LFRLSALFELADEEFSGLRCDMKSVAELDETMSDPGLLSLSPKLLAEYTARGLTGTYSVDDILTLLVLLQRKAESNKAVPTYKPVITEVIDEVYRSQADN